MLRGHQIVTHSPKAAFSSSIDILLDYTNYLSMSDMLALNAVSSSLMYSNQM